MSLDPELGQVVIEITDPGRILIAEVRPLQYLPELLQVDHAGVISRARVPGK